MDNKHQGGEPVPPTKPQERLVSNKEKYATCTEAASGSGSGALSSSRWSRQETQALLKIRSEMDDAFHGSSMKGNLWEDISRALAGLGYRRSAKRCKEKFEKVYKIYKHTKELHTVRQDQGEPRQESVKAPVSSDGPVLAPSQSMASGAVELHHLQPMSLDNISSFFPMSESELESSKGCEEDMMITGEVGSSPALVDKSNRSGGGGGGGGKELTALFDGFMKQVVKRQEEMQQRFLEALEKREVERRARQQAGAAMEEAWCRQELAWLNREHELQQQPPQPKHKETTQHDVAWASLNLHPSKSLTDEPSVLNYATPGTVESSTSTQHPIATPDSAQNSTMQQTHDPSTFQNSSSFFTWTSDEYSPGFNSSKFVLETTLRGMHEVIKLAECWVHKDSIANLLQEAKDTV